MSVLIRNASTRTLLVAKANKGRRLALAPGEGKPVAEGDWEAAQANPVVTAWLDAGDLVIGDEGPDVEALGLDDITGSATAAKLREAGFEDVLSVATAEPEALTEVQGIGEARAAELIEAAQAAIG